VNQVVDALNLPQLAGAQLVDFVLVIARIGPLFLLAPVLSATFLPARAKFVMAAAISLALAPVAGHGVKVPNDPIRLALMFSQEIGVGIAFALSLAVLAAAIEAGASLLDTTVGFSFGALVDPITGNNSAVLGRTYMIFSTMIFVIGGGVQLMVAGLARSYDLVPLGSFPSTGGLAKLAVDGLANVPVIGLELVGPVLLAVVVTDCAMGLVARAVPQMNVFVIGLPIKVIVSFAVIAVSLPFVSQHLQSDLQQSLTDTLNVFAGR
jgi:flagellar biosynthesis protein FliR